MKRSSGSPSSGSRARKGSATGGSRASRSSSSSERFLVLTAPQALPAELGELLPVWGSASVWEQAPDRWRVYPEAGFALPDDFAARFPQVTARWEEEEKVDWAARYQASLHPFPVGRRFVVLPSPGMANPWPGRIALRLVPGGAFGTGEHFTTASCLRAFEELEPRPDRVLDAGCGTGILAAAACLAGCPEVVAFDIDPEAVRVAGETAEANGVSYRLFVGGPEAATGLFDCVFANILAETLVEHMAALAARVRPGGILLSSGIAFEKAPMVREAAQRQSLQVEEMRTDATWWTISWRKKER